MGDKSITLPTSTAVQKSEWRKELAQEGHESLEHRDHLTADALSMAKWTILTLVLGVTLVIGIQRWQQRTSGGAAGDRIRIVETLTLGRSQGLKLVEVAGERFLIASDQGGIKSVTLLPSWPQLDQDDAAATSRPANLPAGPRLFEVEHTELAAG